MCRVLTLLEEAPGRRLSRAELEKALEPEGFRPDNVLRAVRALSRMWLVGLTERRLKAESWVILPEKVEDPLSDEEVLALLRMAQGSSRGRG